MALHSPFTGIGSGRRMAHYTTDTGAAVSLVGPDICKYWIVTLDVVKYPTFQVRQKTDFCERGEEVETSGFARIPSPILAKPDVSTAIPCYSTLHELSNSSCTDARTPFAVFSHSVLQPRAHKAKLQQKSTFPAKPKFTIGRHVHYRNFTRNRPKWVAGKVTGDVGKKMFIVQGPDGHCRRHEDQLKLRSVPKLNRQRRLNCSTPFDSERHTKMDQQRYDNGVPEFDVHQTDEAANE